MHEATSLRARVHVVNGLMCQQGSSRPLVPEISKEDVPGPQAAPAAARKRLQEVVPCKTGLAIKHLRVRFVQGYRLRLAPSFAHMRACFESSARGKGSA